VTQRLVGARHNMKEIDSLQDVVKWVGMEWGGGGLIHTHHQHLHRSTLPHPPWDRMGQYRPQRAHTCART
jgi:hypothetical protein